MKTVRKDLKVIAAILPEGWSIETQRGKGVFLHRSGCESTLAFQQRIGKMNKMNDLVQFLLHNEGGSSLVEISRALFYSESTISKMLKLVRNELKTYPLHLETKPIRIGGGEFERRRLYYDFYVKKKTMPTLPQPQMDSIRLLMRKIEAEGELVFADEAHALFPVLLSIWIGRLKKKQYITDFVYPEHAIQMGNAMDKLMPLLDSYLHAMNISAPAGELRYGAAIILGIPRFMHEPALDGHDQAEANGAVSRRLIEDVERASGMAFRADSNLRLQVQAYLTQAEARWATGIDAYVNPYAATIKKAQAALFRLVKQAMRRNCPTAGSISEDDVANVTMLFAASQEERMYREREKTILVCACESGVAGYLTAKLKMQLNGQLRILSSPRSTEIGTYVDTENVNMVITTNPEAAKRQGVEIPVMLVSPFLSDNELMAIKAMLDM